MPPKKLTTEKEVLAEARKIPSLENNLTTAVVQHRKKCWQVGRTLRVLPIAFEVIGTGRSANTALRQARELSHEHKEGG